MTVESLEGIAMLLGELGSPRVFATRRTAPIDDLRVDVKGVGKLRLPVSQAQARKLRGIGRPARYGQGELTLLDRRVRDTWEIPKSRVKIDQRTWNQTLRPMLETVRSDLGLPEGHRLKADFHAMLLYGPGQFFAPHQDSEKADDMVGTLVVMLPGSFRGGAFVIEHQGEKVTYRGSKKHLACVAFYADCRHEVRPVQTGFRIVLTYNLILHNPSAAAESLAPAPDPDRVERVAACLLQHFETPLPAYRYSARSGDLREPPHRMVYLLDHQYTQSGLAWHRLKGNDALRAAALQAAARAVDCELVLALAEVHENWSCMEPEWERPWGRRRRYWHRDEEDDWSEEEPLDDSPDAYELGELIDWGITLNRWIEPGKKRATKVSTRVDGEEVCSTTPSSELEPYSSEYEGYMGNYGNTMDRWYRRAAIAVWPAAQAFEIRAEASPTWALNRLQKIIRGGELDEARSLAESLRVSWAGTAAQEESKTFFDKALRVAPGLDDRDLAQSLLQPFLLEELTTRRAPAFVALTAQYGEEWAHSLLTTWSAGQSYRRGQARRNELEWIAALPSFCKALLSADDEIGRQSARPLLRDRWAHLQKAIAASRQTRSPSRRQKDLATLGAPIRGLLDGCKLSGDRDLREEIVSYLSAEGKEDLLPTLIGLLRKAAKRSAGTRTISPALGPLLRQGIAVLQARLECPQRKAGDWSIPLPAGCECELCLELQPFLSDPGLTTLEWPINKQKRLHIHQRLDAHELPVRHQTRRSGSPYKLLLTKTKALFEQEARARRSAQSDLEWLLSLEIDNIA